MRPKFIKTRRLAAIILASVIALALYTILNWHYLGFLPHEDSLFAGDGHRRDKVLKRQRDLAKLAEEKRAGDEMLRSVMSASRRHYESLFTEDVFFQTLIEANDTRKDRTIGDKVSHDYEKLK